MGIQKVTIIQYRPEANGLCERANRKVLEALRKTVGGNDKNWDRYIDVVRYNINTMVCDSIKTSPFEALFGCQARGTFDLLTIPHHREDTIEALISTVKERHTCLNRNLMATTREMVERSNSRTSDVKIKVGEKVFLKINVRNELNYKLGPKFEGPFRVVEEKTGNGFIVLDEKTGRSKLTHINTEESWLW
ncbi:uncharacterized protein LOC135209386 [Macrobrachium nipponense]|uniref:uncharacterized protein LOC135209386 n=1 Tax=Macrobrachium nipponense TaxID=159736 RepID=UPI0030C8D038